MNEEEEERYCCGQLVTYLGNKRKLLSFIGKGVEIVRRRLGKEKLSCYDAFSGSGVVSRYMKRYASALYSNDLEMYAAVLGRCYLTNRSRAAELQLEAEHERLMKRIEELWAPGLVAELYAPQDDERIRRGERVFYTRRNAVFLDTARRAIEELPELLRPYFLAPLLYEASVHTNTGGVFKGFYKAKTGIGQFGGQKKQALPRIMGEISLPMPCFSQYECPCTVLQGDAAEVARRLPEVDLAYLDPPYNQHPYGSNYFMLNLIATYERPKSISAVSGIPAGWNHSAYNTRGGVGKALQELLAAVPAKYALMSYNSTGLLSAEEICALAAPDWRVKALEQSYPSYRAGRNLRKRASSVCEYLFVFERK